MKTQTKTLKLYCPHETQRRFHAMSARYRVGAWGRQSGKSTACLNDMLKFMWENPGVTVWFVSPTVKQAKVQYRRMLGMLWKSREILLKKNQTELRLKLINQSQGVFVSGEVLDNLRGETLHRGYVDEVRDQHPDLWPMVLRPMLSTTGGGCTFISTPNGFDQFFDLYDRAVNDTSGRWGAIAAPSTANPLFTQEEFDEAMATMSEGQFAQEIRAEFRDLHRGKAYVNYGDHNHMMQSPWATRQGEQVTPYLPVILMCDFNLTPMTWHLGQSKNRKAYIFDEIWLEDSHTPEAAAELVARLLVLKEQGYMKMNPNVIITGDQTSEAGQRAAGGKSDYDIICQALKTANITFQMKLPTKNPKVKDRVNTHNAALRAADGTISLYFNPVKNPKLKRDYQRVAFKPGALAILDQDTDKLLTHASDGVGYFVCEFLPIPDLEPVGRLTILRR